MSWVKVPIITGHVTFKSCHICSKKQLKAASQPQLKIQNVELLWMDTRLKSTTITLRQKCSLYWVQLWLEILYRNVPYDFPMLIKKGPFFLVHLCIGFVFWIQTTSEDNTAQGLRTITYIIVTYIYINDWTSHKQIFYDVSTLQGISYFSMSYLFCLEYFPILFLAE